MNPKVDNIPRILGSFLESPRTILAMVLFGLIWRVSQYAANRSLWLDESMVALNIIGRSFESRLQPRRCEKYTEHFFIVNRKYSVDG